VPGQLYLAFEVGDNSWQTGNSDIIEIEGNDGIRRRWMPVEITVPEEGFTRACRIGSGEWRRYGKEAALYPPVTVPASTNYRPEMPEPAVIIRAMEAELRKQ